MNNKYTTFGALFLLLLTAENTYAGSGTAIGNGGDDDIVRPLISEFTDRLTQADPVTSDLVASISHRTIQISDIFLGRNELGNAALFTSQATSLIARTQPLLESSQTISRLLLTSFAQCVLALQSNPDTTVLRVHLAKTSLESVILLLQSPSLASPQFIKAAIRKLLFTEQGAPIGPNDAYTLVVSAVYLRNLSTVLGSNASELARQVTAFQNDNRFNFENIEGLRGAVLSYLNGTN